MLECNIGAGARRRPGVTSAACRLLRPAPASGGGGSPVGGRLDHRVRGGVAAGKWPRGRARSRSRTCSGTPCASTCRVTLPLGYGLVYRYPGANAPRARCCRMALAGVGRGPVDRGTLGRRAARRPASCRVRVPPAPNPLAPRTESSYQTRPARGAIYARSA